MQWFIVAKTEIWQQCVGAIWTGASWPPSLALPLSLTSLCLSLSLSLFFILFPADCPHRLSARLSKVILSVVTGRVLLDVQLEMGYGYTIGGGHQPGATRPTIQIQLRVFCPVGRKLGSQVKTGRSMTTNVSPPLWLQLPAEKRRFPSFWCAHLRQPDVTAKTIRSSVFSSLRSPSRGAAKQALVSQVVVTAELFPAAAVVVGFTHTRSTPAQANPAPMSADRLWNLCRLPSARAPSCSTSTV